ncbi:MAG TPA: metalloenzyme [Blastocatellia bacterium]|nr:metalloenzyme [Blastocatellia bacterium]
MGVLLIFIDGVGIGTRGKHNPLDGLNSEFFSIFQGEESPLPFNGRLAVTDARMGVEGLPQSATGQTAILTGVNAAQLIGRHLHGYPSPRLKHALAQESIYRKLIALGRTVTFANAYTRSYLESRPRFVSCTTVAAETAGLRFRMLEDLAEGRAVSHDFTNRFLIDRGFDVKELEPREAGRNLARLAADHDFTLYEHFITDRMGHYRDRELSWKLVCEHVPRLTLFIRAVLEAVDLDRQTVVITSDHGNIEDATTRGHTLNSVATLAFGPARDHIAARVRSLTDITPSIIAALVA